jgi:hypothetical protein
MRQAGPKEIEALPGPKPFLNRIYDNYAKHMSEAEFLKSEPLWSGAANMSEAQGIPQHESFANIANEISKMRGSGQYLSPDDALRIMGRQQLNSLLKRNDEYARGGKVGGRLSKQAAGYEPSGDENRICVLCSMWRDKYRCSLVVGHVDRTATCNHFEKA